MEDKRKAHEKKLDTLLKEWNAQIAYRKIKAENDKAYSKIDIRQIIRVLEHK
jgi:hypothetical protein